MRPPRARRGSTVCAGEVGRQLAWAHSAWARVGTAVARSCGRAGNAFGRLLVGRRFHKLRPRMTEPVVITVRGCEQDGENGAVVTPGSQPVLAVICGFSPEEGVVDDSQAADLGGHGARGAASGSLFWSGLAFGGVDAVTCCCSPRRRLCGVAGAPTPSCTRTGDGAQQQLQSAPSSARASNRPVSSTRSAASTWPAVRQYRGRFAYGHDLNGAVPTTLHPTTDLPSERPRRATSRARRRTRGGACPAARRRRVRGRGARRHR